MGALRESGSTRLNLSAGGAGALRNELLEAVREAAAGEFTVLGEIGRAAEGSIAFLARDLASRQLVALRLAQSGAAGNEYLLEVADRLGASIPAPPSHCPYCRAPVRGWGRFCPQCRSKLWRDRSVDESWTKQDLLEAVRQATEGRFELLGHMVPAEGGGVIHFVRDIETGRIEALRLQREGPNDYSIGFTGVMKQFAGPITKHKPKR